MKIVIIGLGTIGKTVLKSLSTDEHTITVIDENKEKVEKLIEKYDIFGVTGNGACMDIQREASVQDADLVIALTRSDELNMIACLIAKKLGAKNTVARVRNPDYHKQIGELKDDFGISMVVNPERDTAGEIFNLINLPSATHVERFAKGRVMMLELTLDETSPLVGESLVSLSKLLTTRVLICAVVRGDAVIIPSGYFVLEAGDKIHVTADSSSLGAFLNDIHVIKSPLKNVMIVGGSKVAYYLANELSKRKYAIKLIEENKEMAEELAESLHRVTVVHGKGTQHDLLMEEGIESMDAFVAITDIDEENMVASMYANQMHVKRTIAQIKNDELHGMLTALGITNNVSPRDVVASRIISYIRALANSRGSNIQTLYCLVDDQVEALEFVAKKQERFFDRPLKDLKLKDNCLIACIVRKNDVIIPDGNSTIKYGDSVIVVTTHKNFDDLSDVIE